MPLRREYLSTDEEPALGAGDRPEVDPSEYKTRRFARGEGEPARLRDSLAAEPALAETYDPGQWARWIESRRRACSWPVSLAIALLAAVVAFPVAVVAVAVVGLFVFWQIPAILAFYGLLIGPIAEEFLKQAGMIYLLEIRPWRVFAAWQIVCASVVSGLAFAAVKGALTYSLMLALPDSGMASSWAVWHEIAFAALQVACAVLASFGLVHAWRRHRTEQRPVELGRAFPWFVAAMALHATGNLAAWWFPFS